MLFHVINKHSKLSLAIHSSHASASLEVQYWKDKLGTDDYEVRAACLWCDRVNENDPSDYYHASSCEARFIRDCIKRETDPEVIKQLNKRLEKALYVGD